MRLKTILRPDRLEAREVPAAANPFGIPEPIPGFTGEVVAAGGDFNGDGSADWGYTPAEGSGGSIRLVVRSGGTPGTPLVIGPDGIGYDPTFNIIIKDVILNDPSFRNGAVIAPVQAPEGGYAILAVSPGKGGGAIVNLVDLKKETITAQFIMDEDYRGGVRFTSLPPLSGIGAPDSLILATPAPGGGGGPRATIFNGRGEVLRSFFIGPAEHRGNSYQPYPYGAGVSAPDNSGVMGSWFAADGVGPFFMDINGLRRDRVGPFTNSDGTVIR